MLSIAPGCELDVQRGPDWLLVRIDSLDLEQHEAVPLADEIWALIERHFTHRLVLDVRNVPRITRHVISELLQLYQRVADQGGVMRVCHLTPRNERVLHACRLDDRLMPYATWEEAVMGITGPRHAK